MNRDIQCLLNAGLITEDQANELATIIGKLPSGQTALLQLLVALFMNGGFSGGFDGATEINNNYTVLPSDKTKVLHVTANSVITFNEESPAFVIIEADGATVTLNADGDRTLGGYPLVFSEGFVIVYLDGTEYRVLGTGEANTVSNAGTAADGVGIVKAKIGVDIPIKRIKAQLGSGRFFENENGIEYVAEGKYLPGVQTYVTNSAMAGDPRVIDDLFAFLMGYPSSVSLLGTVWDQLSENIFTKLRMGYIFHSAYNAGTGTTVYPIKSALNGTIGGGMTWGASGFVFDGVDDRIALGSAVVTTAQEWTLISVHIEPTAGGVARGIASQNAGGANRGAFMLYETDGSLRVFQNDGSTTINPTTGISESDPDPRIIMSRWTIPNGCQIFKDTALTAPTGQTVVAAPRIFQNTPYIIGSTTSAFAGPYFGTMKAHFFFDGIIDVGDKNKLRTFLNNSAALNMGIQA